MHQLQHARCGVRLLGELCIYSLLIPSSLRSAFDIALLCLACKYRSV